MVAPDGGGYDEAGKRECRATITFFLLFITLFALTIPTTTVQIIIAQIAVRVSVTFVIQVLSSGIISLLVLTDPIVIMRNKDVQEILLELKTSLGCKYCMH